MVNEGDTLIFTGVVTSTSRPGPRPVEVSLIGTEVPFAMSIMCSKEMRVGTLDLQIAFENKGQVYFRQGDRVVCLLFGEGTVTNIVPDDYPFSTKVTFDTNRSAVYTFDGRLFEDANITLHTI